MNVECQISALPERLREKIYIEPNSGCWLWMGSINSDGYGNAWHFGASFKTHRLIWLLFRRSDPELLHHRCQTRSCCNPLHLEAIERKEHQNRHQKILCRSGRHLLDQTRDSQGTCRECKNERMRLWYRSHADEYRKRHRDYHQANRSRDNERQRRNYQKNKTFET